MIIIEMSSYFKKAIRFIEIDSNYLSTPLPFLQKILIILKTDLTIAHNLLFRKKTFSPITLNHRQFFYDTPFATKTFLTAVYDLSMVSMKKKIIRSENPTIIDVGANIGQFLFAIKTLFPNAMVYSIEPDKEIFSLLKKNAKNFSKVELINTALSNESRTLQFYISSEFSEWSSLKKLQGKSYREVKVNAVKGDTLF